MKPRYIAVLFLLLLPLVSWGQTEIQSSDMELFQKILKEIDEWDNFTHTDLSFTWEIVSLKPGQDMERHDIRVFRRDREDKFLWVMIKPEVMRGQATLVVGDNIWYYDPESRKTVHESLKSNIGDTEVKNEDVEGFSFTKDYRITGYEAGKLGPHECYILSLEAQNNEVAFPYTKLWISQKGNFVLKEEEYSLSQRLMRVSQFGKYIKVKGKRVPTKMLFLDMLNQGEKSLVTAMAPSTAVIEDETFTKTFLERIGD